MHAGWHVWLSRVEGALRLPAESGASRVLVGTLAQPLRHYKSDVTVQLPHHLGKDLALELHVGRERQGRIN